MGQLSATLRERGYRLTVQREIILDAIESIPGHLSAEDVYDRVRGQFPQVNVSTVYRTLDLLESEGLVTHAHLEEDVARWHRAEDANHHHLVCDRCGAEQKLDFEVVEPLLHAIRDRYGFQAHLDHLAIRGLCAICLAETAAKHSRG
jgi:Fur family transcriptional regulator, ferric uptake regulator